MFDEEKMFDDSGRMIASIAEKRPPVSEVMHVWLDYCRNAAPVDAETWDRLAALDFAADFERLTEWLTGLLRTEPPPDDVNCLRFGLYNPDVNDEPSLQMYLSGTTGFDLAEPFAEWPGAPDYCPAGRYANSSVLPAIYAQVDNALEGDEFYLGEAFLGHGYTAAVVANFCNGPLADQLVGPMQSRAIEMGHDGGDTHFIQLPS